MKKVVIKNGIPNCSKNINCKTSATKNNLRDAPNILDKRKYEEPDL